MLAKSGGNVNLTAGNTTITSLSDSTLGPGVATAIQMSGTVTHNNGTIILADSSGSTHHIILKDVQGSNPLNNLDVNNSGAYIMSGGANLKMKVNGNLSMRHPSALFVNSNNGNNPLEVGGKTTVWGELRAGSGANANFIFNDSVTINSGGRFGSPSVAEGTNYSTSMAGALTVNAGGTLAASTAGAFNFSGTTFTQDGTFNPNGGWFSFSRGATSSSVVAQTITSTSGTAQVNFDNVNITNNTQLRTQTPLGFDRLYVNGTYRQDDNGGSSFNVRINRTLDIGIGSIFSLAGDTANRKIILGNATTSATVTNSGTFRTTNTCSTNACAVEGDNAAQQFTAVGNDWDWDGGGSGTLVNTKWGDLQFDATTGGSGVTVNFTGNMSINGFSVTAGDTLNITTPNTIITGISGGGNDIVVRGRIFILPATPNVTVNGVESLDVRSARSAQIRYLNWSSSGSNNGNVLTLDAGGNINISDSTFEQKNTGYSALRPTNNADATNADFRNLVLIGGNSGSTLSRDIVVRAGTKFQCRNCTYTTVGIDGNPSGFFISRDDNGIVDDWKIYGALNSTDANATMGYQAGNWTSSTNVTIMNATVYSTFFRSVYNLTENSSINKLNISAGTFNISGNSQLTFTNTLQNSTINGTFGINRGQVFNLTLGGVTASYNGNNIAIAHPSSILNNGTFTSFIAVVNISNSGANGWAQTNISYNPARNYATNTSNIRIYSANTTNWNLTVGGNVETASNYAYVNFTPSGYTLLNIMEDYTIPTIPLFNVTPETILIGQPSDLKWITSDNNTIITTRLTWGDTDINTTRNLDGSMAWTPTMEGTNNLTFYACDEFWNCNTSSTTLTVYPVTGPVGGAPSGISEIISAVLGISNVSANFTVAPSFYKISGGPNATITKPIIINNPKSGAANFEIKIVQVGADPSYLWTELSAKSLTIFKESSDKIYFNTTISANAREGSYSFKIIIKEIGTQKEIEIPITLKVTNGVDIDTLLATSFVLAKPIGGITEIYVWQVLLVLALILLWNSHKIIWNWLTRK